MPSPTTVSTEPAPQDVYFEVRFPFDRRRDLVWKEVCLVLQRQYIPPDSRILDLGAGYCNFINNVVGRERHAVDIYRRMPEYAGPGVVAHVQSCTSLDRFRDDSFDLVFASNLFEHLSREDLSGTLREIRRVLRPAGRLMLLQPNFKYCSRVYFDDYTHQQIFTDAGLSDLLEVHGLRPIAVKSRFLPVNMKSTLRLSLPALWLITRVYLRLPFKPFAGQMLIVAENSKPAVRHG
jgi:SAM-dependent methyltransferase